MDTKRLSRRQLGMVAVAAAVPVGSAAAQQPATAAPATDLESARDKTRDASAALRKVKLPQLLEPSVVFRP